MWALSAACELVTKLQQMHLKLRVAVAGMVLVVVTVFSWTGSCLTVEAAAACTAAAEAAAAAVSCCWLNLGGVMVRMPGSTLGWTAIP